MNNSEYKEQINTLLEDIQSLDNFVDDNSKEIYTIIDKEYKDYYNIAIESDISTIKTTNDSIKETNIITDESNNLTNDILLATIVGILSYKISESLLKSGYKVSQNKVLDHILEENSITIRELINNYKKNRRKRFTNIFKNAYQNDLTFTDIIKQFKKLKQTDKNHIKTIQRTSSMASFNQRNMDKWVVESVNFILYSAILDSRTTDLCRSRNGNIYDIKKAPYLPAHVNCRSVYIKLNDNKDLPSKEDRNKIEKEVLKQLRTD